MRECVIENFLDMAEDKTEKSEADRKFGQSWSGRRNKMKASEENGEGVG